MALAFGVAVLVSTFAGVPDAGAYEFSSATEDACPACTTPTGQREAAELAEGLTINGAESETFGSTATLAADATEASGAASDGAGTLAWQLLKTHWVDALAESPLGTTGLIIGTFQTGYVAGTLGRSLFITLFGGDGQPSGATLDPWSNGRWLLCTRSPYCQTNLQSTATTSSVIPRYDVYVAWQDHWSGKTNVSAPVTSGWTDCHGATPPNPPCQLVPAPGWGPQAGELPHRHAVTVYGVATDERPGSVFTQTLEGLLSESPAPRISTTYDPANRWGTVPADSAPSQHDLLQTLDGVIAGNSAFGGWVQGQISDHPKAPDCAGLTVSVCAAQAGPDATIVVGSGNASDANAIIDHQSTPAYTDLHDGDQITVNTVPWTPQPPMPFPATYHDEADAAARRITDTNVDVAYTPTQIDDISKRCVWIAIRVPGVGPDDCGKPEYRILITAGTSGVGANAPTLGATQHDFNAIKEVPEWFVLNYERSTGKPGQGTWYQSKAPCLGNVAQVSGKQCHEFPYFSTEQGGPLASQRSPFAEPRLGLVDTGDNTSQGTLLSAFYRNARCPLTSGTVVPGQNASGGTSFLLVPVPLPALPSGWLCNRSPSGG